MASSNEVSWQSAYWALLPLAVNSMLQPAGQILGFDASLRIFLRSSSIVCAMDAALILIRFAFYAWYRHPAGWAAREIIFGRGYIPEHPDPEDAVNEAHQPGRFLLLERNFVLFYLVLGLGSCTQLVKLLACSGIPWTQVWGSFYFLSFLVVDVTYRLGKAERDPYSRPTENKALKSRINLLNGCENICGIAAILLQLAILASVDMKAIPPNPVLISRWKFYCIRFSAHFAVCLVHVPFMALNIDAGDPMSDNRWGLFLMSILVPQIIVAFTRSYRFSQLYFVVSLIISYFSWMLYFFPKTRKYVLLCGPGDNRRRREHVLAFDFFCRILYFSTFWYAVHFDSTGTVKPLWTNNLG